MDKRQRTIGLLVTFAGAFIVFLLLFLRFPLIYDSDSYYHLAVARHYLDDGLFAPNSWARFSILDSGADKEFLFHVALMPFVAFGDAATGGRVALALFNAMIVTTIASLAVEAIGRIGWAVPWWLYLTATPFFARVIRLRPELAALLLIIIAIRVASQRRPLALGIVAALFTLSYTAFHVLVALCVGWMVIDGLLTKSWKASLALAPAAGAIAGLLLRPHPIEHLQIWFVQNVSFFLNKNTLDVGNEIGAPQLDMLAMESAGWIAGAVVLLFAPRLPQSDEERRRCWLTVATAGFFAILFLVMARMATYVFPLITLAAVSLPPRRSPIRSSVLAGALAVSALVALPFFFNPSMRAFLFNRALEPESEWAAVGRKIPPGAKVAATWGEAEVYAFWAPQGRYLNVLDPIFMAHRDRRLYEVYDAVFDGREPDIPLKLARELDSQYLAFDASAVLDEFLYRIARDPRLRSLHARNHVLLAVEPSRSFVVDWATQSVSLRPGHPMTGYIDASSAKEACARFVHELELAAAEDRVYEFAPWGPGSLRIDGQLRAETRKTPRAILGAGAVIPAKLGAGRHTIEVETCRATGGFGFYLLQRR